MKSVIRPGDNITIVGGGYGVSTVYASRMTGDEGAVRTFEGATNMVENTRQACRMRLLDNVAVYHAVVATANALRGDSGDATSVSPEELPVSDVLILDCEGAERQIIPAISPEPRAIVVETHGLHGTPPELVRRLLLEEGYAITFNEPMSIDQGISIFVGKRDAGDD
jgi:hypothetical protein